MSEWINVKDKFPVLNRSLVIFKPHDNLHLVQLGYQWENLGDRQHYCKVLSKEDIESDNFYWLSLPELPEYEQEEIIK